MYNFPYDSKNIVFFGYARKALEYGFKYLGFKAGDEVLYPEYICDVMMVPCNNLGIKVQFYEVDDNFEPKLDKAVRLINKKTKALLAINYFGFPQPFDKIKAFCKEYNLFFIEDSAHSFLSSVDGNFFGSFGDIAILSFRKMIAIVNGAALVINKTKNGGILDHIRTEASSLPLERDRTKRLRSFLYRVESDYAIPFSRLRKRKLMHLPHGYSENEDLPYGIDQGSLKVLRTWNWNKEITRRRMKYDKWVSLLEPLGVMPVFGKLEKNTVPMACPVFSSDRDKWLNYFLEKGIKVTMWPTLPLWVSKNCSNALGIWDRLILFPI